MSHRVLHFLLEHYIRKEERGERRERERGGEEREEGDGGEKEKRGGGGRERERGERVRERERRPGGEDKGDSEAEGEEAEEQEKKTRGDTPMLFTNTSCRPRI